MIFVENMNFTYKHLFCCNHTCYCVGMVSVMSASCYVMSVSCCQSISSMYIRDLIPQNSTVLGKAVPIAGMWCSHNFQATVMPAG